MWVYHQNDGDFLHEQVFIGTGYSGMGDGKNNTALEQVPNLGPIPRGGYIISPAYDDIGHLGPCVMALNPQKDTNTFGRSLFRIHGDNKRHDASHGCIILGPAIRRQVAGSPDRLLRVV